jgi:hypothetical protein
VGFLHAVFVTGRQGGSRPTAVRTGGWMDLVVIAIVLALAALSFVWLAFVEKA